MSQRSGRFRCVRVAELPGDRRPVSGWDRDEAAAPIPLGIPGRPATAWVRLAQPVRVPRV